MLKNSIANCDLMLYVLKKFLSLFHLYINVINSGGILYDKVISRIYQKYAVVL